VIDFSTYPDLIGFANGIDSADDLAAAGAAVRAECGWHIAPRVTETLTLDSDGGYLLTLPSLFVVEVTAVTDADDAALEDWSVSSLGLLERTGCRLWPKGYGKVKVTLTHGLSKAPPDLVAVIVELARELKVSATTPAGVEAIGPFTFGPAGGAGSWTTQRLSVLKRYRLP